MAVFTLFDPSVLESATGDAFYTMQTPSRVGINYPATGLTVEFSGSFTYSGGDLSAGFITGANYTRNGSVQASITGVGFTVAQFSAASAISPDAVGNLLYGGDDQFFGSIFGEVLLARSGNDTVIALDGDDVVYGGAGNDDVNGNVGQDVVYGDDGADIVRGGKGNDTTYGGAGDDPHVNGNIGDDLVFGGLGNDTVYGGQDQDTLHGDAGNDLLSGDLGNDVLYGETGADRFVQRIGGGIDWIADFNAMEGDRIVLTPGATYTVLNSGGQVMIDLGGGAQIGLAGVTFGSFSADWIVGG